MKRKNVVLGICGGIAAYKAAVLASKLTKEGFNVDTIFTENGAKFVTPLTLETITGNRAVTDMFERPDNRDVEHITLAKKADIIVIAPATYNIIGKIASGIADDMLTTVIAASKSKVVFVPAMNTGMYENPIFLENRQKLEKIGYYFIDSTEGRLACRDIGKGRMEEPDRIFEEIERILGNAEQPLRGKKVLISAGPTEEPIDPIRVLTNRSTGKMGYGIAVEARNMGAEVTLISGPVSIETPSGIEVIRVKTALQMEVEINKKYSDCDIAIMTAAVADYRMKEYSDKKIKKGEGEITFTLARNPDILLEMGKTKNNQYLVGFAAESENIIEYAFDKLEKKNLDMIIANSTAAFGSETNTIHIIDRNRSIKNLPELPKKEAAVEIMNEIVKNLEKGLKK